METFHFYTCYKCHAGVGMDNIGKIDHLDDFTFRVFCDKCAREGNCQYCGQPETATNKCTCGDTQYKYNL